jgi:aspartate/methionine/tyrosine aminotransferase
MQVMKPISRRAREVSLEPFRLALALPKDVIRLSVGEPDFDTPEFIREAAKKSIDEGFTHYTPASGYEDLRKAVAEKLHRENGITYDYEKEIVITPGSSSGIFLAMLTLLDPGDEVLVPDPAWFHYRTLINLCGAKSVGMPVKFIDNSSTLDLEETRRRVTDKTKILILNTPSNPTGLMLSREVLKEVGEFAEKHNLWIISDEVYEKIVYPGNTHISPASLADLKERTLTSNGFSKAYSMTGWRVGFLAGQAEIMEKVAALNGYTSLCASSVSQRAALTGLTNRKIDAAIKKMVDRFTKRREMVLEALTNLPGIKAYPPQGAFYTWIDITGTGMSSETFAAKLIEKEKVGLLPGPLFGELGKGHVRISFSTGEDKLKEALERFRRFVLSNH